MFGVTELTMGLEEIRAFLSVQASFAGHIKRVP